MFNPLHEKEIVSEIVLLQDKKAVTKNSVIIDNIDYRIGCLVESLVYEPTSKYESNYCRASQENKEYSFLLVKLKEKLINTTIPTLIGAITIRIRQLEAKILKNLEYIPASQFLSKRFDYEFIVDIIEMLKFKLENTINKLEKELIAFKIKQLENYLIDKVDYNMGIFAFSKSQNEKEIVSKIVVLQDKKALTKNPVIIGNIDIRIGEIADSLVLDPEIKTEINKYITEKEKINKHKNMVIKLEKMLSQASNPILIDAISVRLKYHAEHLITHPHARSRFDIFDPPIKPKTIPIKEQIILLKNKYISTDNQLIRSNIEMRIYKLELMKDEDEGNELPF